MGFQSNMTGVLIRTRREDSHVKTQAVGVLLSQAREYLGLSAAGTGKNRYSPRGFGASMALMTS